MSATFASAGGRQVVATAGSPQGVQLYGLRELEAAGQGQGPGLTSSSSSYPGSFLAVAISGDGSQLAAAGEALPLAWLPPARAAKQAGQSGAPAGAEAAGRGGGSKGAALAAAAGVRRRRQGPRAAGEPAVRLGLQGLQLGGQGQQLGQQQEGAADGGLFGELGLGAGGAPGGDPSSSVVASNGPGEAELHKLRERRAAEAAEGAGGGGEGGAGAGDQGGPEACQGASAGPATRAPILLWRLI
jgi:hypothetical protein